jgi:hypothetical protein
MSDRVTVTTSRLRRRALSASTIALAALLAGPTAGLAGPATCGVRAEIVAELTQRYREAPVAFGLANSGELVEVLTNDAGTSWSILVSQPNGMTCLVAAGKEWQELKRAARDLGV